MDNEVQTFIVEDENGISYEAEIITMLDVEGREYLIYSIPTDEENVTICASQVIKDEKGEDKLIDIELNDDKEKILKFIEKLSED